MRMDIEDIGEIWIFGKVFFHESLHGVLEDFLRSLKVAHITPPFHTKAEGQAPPHFGIITKNISCGVATKYTSTSYSSI